MFKVLTDKPKRHVTITVDNEYVYGLIVRVQSPPTGELQHVTLTKDEAILLAQAIAQEYGE